MALNLHVQLDVDYQDDPKIIRAGHLGETLYVRSLAKAKRLMNDGIVYREQLDSLAIGLPAKPAALARKLVDVGLWKTHRDGWQISAWRKRNASAAAIKAKVDRKKASAIKANHERWHAGEKGRPNDECPLCYPDDDPKSIRTGSDSESTKVKEEEHPPVEEPEEEHPSGRRSSSVLTVVPDHAVDDDDLNRVIELIVDGRAIAYPPRNPRTWRPVARRNTITEDGDLIRRMLGDGTHVEQVALFVLGHGTGSERDHAASQVPWCTNDCECAGDGWIFTDPDGNPIDHDTPNAIGPIPCPNRQAS